MHAAAYAYVAAAAAKLRTPTSVVDLGGLNVNGSPRHLFDRSRYTSVDIVFGIGVDVVADAATWRPSEPADLVLCCEVLEHAPNADKIVTNALRIATSGGTVVITCAGPNRAPHSAVDGGPLRAGEFYRNITRDALLEWVQAAGVTLRSVTMREDETIGDLYCTAEVA